MATSERSSGVRVELPDTFRIGDAAPPALATRGVRRPAGLPPLSADPADRVAENQALLAALGNQEMTHVDTIPLAPTLQATPAAGRRPRGATKVPPRQSVGLSVELGPGERAAVLVEQDGLYSWNLPTRVDQAPVPPPRSRAARRTPRPEGRAAEGRRVARFTLDVRATTPPAGARAARGTVSSFVYGHLRTFVVTWVAAHVVGKAVAVLEQHVRTGLVVAADVDPRTWRRLDDGPPPQLPRNRPARVLLLVHGTFSSTVGAFSALGVLQEGKQLLGTALEAYDVVLGFDHRTLSVDPTENAVELLAALHDMFGDTPPEIDVVCHSRGGLVTRALTELVAPASSWRPDVARVVFVAVPNEGTLLAEPANWQALVDLYTNLSMAAVRALGLLPEAALFADVVNGVVQGLGVLVKVLADATVSDQGAPGLAAMEPSGQYIAALNLTQQGQPTPADSSYYVGASSFEADAAGQPAAELPARLLQLLADGFMDGLMREPNDLVVNVSSMGAIDPAAGGFVDDRLDYPANPVVYHTNYFSQPGIVEHIARWLTLTVPA